MFITFKKNQTYKQQIIVIVNKSWGVWVYGARLSKRLHNCLRPHRLRWRLDRSRSFTRNSSSLMPEFWTLMPSAQFNLKKHSLKLQLLNQRLHELLILQAIFKQSIS